MSDTQLAPHHQRVVSEKDDLDEKLHKLDTFFTSDIFKGLDPAERVRLSRQFDAMDLYSSILGERIAAFQLSGSNPG